MLSLSQISCVSLNQARRNAAYFEERSIRSMNDEIEKKSLIPKMTKFGKWTVLILLAFILIWPLTAGMYWGVYRAYTLIDRTRFAGQDRAVLELKTKTASIKRLKGLDHNRKTITAWSLNTDKIINSEERHTAPLSSRLKAASKCESWGYPLAFHFDPIVIYDGCVDDYKKVIDSIFSHVSSENIAWISLGTFRFMPSLKETVQRRFPDSKIIYGEFIRGIDGKKRYFKPLRLRIYKRILSYIKEVAPEVIEYFCMEDDEIWEKTTGIIPEVKNGLAKILDESAVKICNINSDF